MTSSTDRPTADEALRILVARYPDLPEQAGVDAPPYTLATLAVARVAAELGREHMQGAHDAPVTRAQLNAATALITDARAGVEHAEVVTTAAQRAHGSPWGDIALLRGYAGGATAQKRQERMQTRLGVRDKELPMAPTLPAHTVRAADLIEAGTEGEPSSPVLFRTAADVLGALLLAARYDHVTGAGLRAWAVDSLFAGAAESLSAAPPEAAEAAHQVLAAAAELPAGTRGDINHLVLAGIDVWDPPTEVDQAQP